MELKNIGKLWTKFCFQVRQLKQAVPFAVCGANTLLEVRGRKVRGRLYPWGVVEVENPEHCDFIKLRTMLITHMQDLQEITQQVHYENYRSERLAKGAPPPKRNTYEPFFLFILIFARNIYFSQCFLNYFCSFTTFTNSLFFTMLYVLPKSWFYVDRIIEDKSGIVSEKDRILQEKEAELKRMQEMITAMQAKMQQTQ